MPLDIKALATVADRRRSGSQRIHGVSHLDFTFISDGFRHH
jgi:hypothetical protein